MPASTRRRSCIHTAYGYDNSYVADAVEAVPSCFTAVCSIDVMAPDAVKTFDHWLLRGCTGMAVHHRQHLAGSGDVVRRPEDLSVLGARGGEAFRSACR